MKDRVLYFLGGAVVSAIVTYAAVKPGGIGIDREVGMVADPCDEAQAPLRTRRYLVYSAHCKHRDDNRRLTAAGIRPKVVAIGDSITEIWGEADPALFGEAIANRGVAGQSSHQLLLRFERDVLALRPQIVHILAGTNDMIAPTGGTSPEIYKSNMRAMFDLADHHGIKVIVGTIPPPVDERLPAQLASKPWLAKLNGWLEKSAVERGYVIADYRDALANPDGSAREGIYYDAVHPHNAVYRSLKPVMLDAIARAEAMPSDGAAPAGGDS